MLSAEQIQNLDVRLQNILPPQKIEESVRHVLLNDIVSKFLHNESFEDMLTLTVNVPLKHEIGSVPKSIELNVYYYKIFENEFVDLKLSEQKEFYGNHGSINVDYGLSGQKIVDNYIKKSTLAMFGVPLSQPVMNGVAHPLFIIDSRSGSLPVLLLHGIGSINRKPDIKMATPIGWINLKEGGSYHAFSAKRGEVGQILFEEKIVKKPLAKILDKTDKKEVWKNKDLVCALLAKNFTRTNSGEDLQR